METKNYSFYKKLSVFAKLTFITCLICLCLNRNAFAQGCPVAVALTPITTDCGQQNLDLINPVNAYLTGLGGINLALTSVKVYTDNALTQQLASTVITLSGTYYIKVTLPNVLNPSSPICVASLSIAITFKPNPVAAESHTAILCNGGASTVTISASNGLAPYTGTGDYSQTTANGSTTYTVTDANGCSNTVTVPTISQPTALTANLQTASATALCYGATAGLTVNASGGTPGYTYSINDSTPVATNTYTEQAGTYVVKVKDANGCTVNTNTLTLTQPASNISVAASIKPTACNVNSILVNAAGGYGNFTYSLNNGSYGSGSVFAGQGPGTDAIGVKDDHGCIAGTSVVINASNLAAKLLPGGGVDSVCYDFNKRILTSVTGGIMPYLYKLSGGYQSDSTFLVKAGSFAVTVKDSVGCTVVTSSLAIRQPAVKLKATPVLKITGCDKSTLTLTASGGYGNYKFSVNSSSYQASGVYTNQGPGTDSVAVKDNAGCISKTNVIIAPSGLVATLTSHGDSVSCIGFNKALITSAKGGIAPFVYSLNGGAYQNDNTFIKPAGTYAVKIKDSIGCIATSNTLTIRQPTKLLITSTSKMVQCNQSTLTITAAGGWGGYTYSVNNSPYQSSKVFTSQAPGTDSITIQDNAGCIAKGKAVIPGSILSASLQPGGNSNYTCYGYSKALLTAPKNGVAPYKYSIDGSNYQDGKTFTVPVGTYTVTVRDSIGCTAQTNTVEIKQAAAKLAFTTSSSMTSCDTSTLTVDVTGGFEGYTYSFNGGAYQNSNMLANQTPGVITISVKDNIGCTADGSTTISPANLAASIAAGGGVDSVCFGFNKSVVTTATGGTKPFLYSLNGGPQQSSNNFTQKAGTFSVFVKDAVGCTVTSNTLTITQPAEDLSLSLTKQPISCNNTNITAAAAGGYGNFTYSIDSINYQNNNMFTGLPTGTYKIFTKDNAGCIRNRTTVISAPASPCFSSGSSVAAGSSASSDGVFAGKSGTSNGFDLKLKAYPNPTHGDFNLMIEGKTTNPIVEVRVFDMHGNIVYQTRGASTRSFVFGSKLSSGTYTVQVIDGRNVQSAKLIKAN